MTPVQLRIEDQNSRVPYLANVTLKEIVGWKSDFANVHEIRNP
jgi:hypothetical protein